MDRKSQIEKIALAVVVCGVVGYVLYTFVLTPQWETFKKTLTDSEELEQKVTVAEKKKRSLPRLRDETKEYDKIVTEAEKSFVEGKTFDAFLRVIKGAADKAEIRLEKVQPWEQGTEPYGKLYEEKKVIVETRAPYHQLGKWMREVENKSPFIHIEQINVRTSDASGQQEANVVIGFLVLKEEQK